MRTESEETDMKKLLILVASLAVIITLTVTGTIAYKAVKAPETAATASANLSIAAEATEPSEYEATEPSAYIAIQQNIHQRVDTGDSSTSQGKLKLYNAEEDDGQLLPSPGFNKAENKVTAPVAGADCWGAEAAGGMDRIVTVSNVSKPENGGVDAYVRTVFAMENPDDIVEKLVYLNYNADINVGTWEEIGNMKIDGKDFMLFTFTYKNPVSPGETTQPSLKQIVLDASTTNEDAAALGAEYELRIFSQAVGAANSNSVDDVFGSVTKSNHPWSEAAKTGNLVAVSE